ncbi:MAG: malonyl CoA-acyl carrier protein transacylase [Bacteroidia bacterium]|nr:MAG: malonyl CoA-acyl carrier protein transacylase [Bacteroidia bacterium]
MKTAYIFPGQGSQYPGMGKNLFEKNDNAKILFKKADEILGFPISQIMFEGTAEELKKTSVTQPAIFLHSVILAKCLKIQPDMVAGHSLGEFSALVANGCLQFEDALRLVQIRANAMQKACNEQPSTMAAIVGIEDSVVEEICKSISDTVVVPANYNSPGQLVISGTVAGVEKAMALCKEKGAKIVKKLEVDGAFHSPLMESAKQELEKGILSTLFQTPSCPIYQNYTAKPSKDANEIKHNLIAQLTSPVLWTQSIQNMIQDGATEFMELGPGNVLQGLVKRIDKNVSTSGRTE